MSSVGPGEPVPQAILINSPWEEAAALFEQAARVGKAPPELSYMLALCYKRDDKLVEARTALRKITKPDANVWLQLGLLSYAEKQFEQAEEEFGRAAQLDPNAYPVHYNLFLCRLNLGQLDRCLELLPQLIALAPSAEEQRFLFLVDQLIRSHAAPGTKSPPLPANGNGQAAVPPSLAELSGAEEERLLDLLRSVEQAEAVYPLVQTLAAWRPNSLEAQRACLDLALVQAKFYADRYQWSEADQLLTPLARLAEAAPAGRDPAAEQNRVALLNLQGVCACMLQDFDRAIRTFSAALKWSGPKAWLHQNLALAYEFKGRLDQAETHWNRYFDLLDSRTTPVPPLPNYLESLAFAGLCRLADTYSKHDRLNSAIAFLQRATRVRPHDLEPLEKLFQFYQQAKRPDDARRVLQRLREIRPNDPQFDLFELDLVEIKSMEDLDRILGEIKRILTRHPGDARVEDRAVHAVANCVPLIARRSDQLSQQLNHIADQVRRLPNYQINWPVVHDEMRFLRVEFQKLRKLCNKCLALVNNEEQRRVVRDLGAHVDSRIDVCVSMGG
jgi:tetratricopeptide (TPR) repeat protein